MGRDERLNPTNQLTPEQQKIAQMMREEIAAQGPRLRDRFGRPIVVGAQVLYHTELPLSFVIVDIKPNLDIDAPPGMWMIQLQASLMCPAMQGQPILEMVGVVYPKKEAAAAPPADTSPANPPADAPPTDDAPKPTDASTGEL